MIATQSMGEPMYGELGLDILRAGLTAVEALTALRSVDANPERRQVAMIDTCGNVAVYTGEACVPAAGHLEGNGCVALANMVVSEAVWEAMIDAWEHTQASVPARLARALHAAEDEGGDMRGKRSAAMVVVDPTTTGRPWHDRLVDLRVDDHEDPLGMLDRLLALNTRYHNAVEAFDLALGGNIKTRSPDSTGHPLQIPCGIPTSRCGQHLCWHWATVRTTPPVCWPSCPPLHHSSSKLLAASAR